MTDNEQRLLEILAEVLEIPVGTIKPEQHLRNDLRLDSYQALDLLSAIEEQFEIEIDEVTASKLETVQQVLDFAKQTDGEKTG